MNVWHVDALLRQVTHKVFACEKKWRFQFLKEYDAWELEQAQDPGNIPAVSITSWFIRNSDFDAYDTYECVEKLKKDIEEDNLISEEEILALRASIPAGDIASIQERHKKKRKPLLI